MPSNNSKYTQEMREQTAEYILQSGKSATSKAEESEMSALSRNIFYSVEIFYNRKRLHSTPGSMSPVAYRLQHQQANIA